MRRPFALISILILGTACSSGPQKTTPASEQSSSCRAVGQSASHLMLATKAQARKFSGCFQNYMRLNGLQELEARVCIDLSVEKNGRVSSARAQGDGESLENDLRWCLEQELWTMDYSKLQLPSAQHVSIPIYFKVRK